MIAFGQAVAFLRFFDGYCDCFDGCLGESLDCLPIQTDRPCFAVHCCWKILQCFDWVLRGSRDCLRGFHEIHPGTRLPDWFDLQDQPVHFVGGLPAMNGKGIVWIPIILVALLLGGGLVVAQKIGWLGHVPAGAVCGGVLDQPCESGTTCQVSNPVLGIQSCQVTNTPQFLLERLKLSSLICGSGIASGACASLLPIVSTVLLAALFFVGALALGLPQPMALLAAAIGAILGFLAFSFIDQWWFATLLVAGVFGIVLATGKK